MFNFLFPNKEKAIIKRMIAHLDDKAIYFRDRPPTSRDTDPMYRPGDFWVNTSRWEIYSKSPFKEVNWTYRFTESLNWEYDPNKTYSDGMYVRYGNLNFQSIGVNKPGMRPGVGKWSLRMINTNLSGSVKSRESAIRMAIVMLEKEPGFQWSPSVILDALRTNKNLTLRHIKDIKGVINRMELLCLLGIADKINDRYVLTTDFINYTSKYPIYKMNSIHEGWENLKGVAKHHRDLPYNEDVIKSRGEIFNSIKNYLDNK